MNDDRLRLAPADAEWVMARIGALPRARLTWLFDHFLAVRLEKLSEIEWVMYRTLLDGFAGTNAKPWFRGGSSESPDSEYDRLFDRASRKRRGGQPMRPGEIEMGSWPVSRKFREEIVACQAGLREIFEVLTRGETAHAALGLVTFQCRIRPRGNFPAQPSGLSRWFGGSLFARVLLAALDQLAAVGAERLRKCSLGQPNEALCNRFFVARKRQRFCSRAHTAKAMYLAWRQRGAPRGSRKRDRGRPSAPR